MLKLIACVVALFGLISIQPPQALAKSNTPGVQSVGTIVSLTIKLPSGTSKNFSVPNARGMTVEDAMKIGSGIGGGFKWKATWFDSFWSYLVVEIDGVANEKYVDENSKFWQYCVGPAGHQKPSARGISLFGLAPNDSIIWKFAKSGGLSCP